MPPTKESKQFNKRLGRSLEDSNYELPISFQKLFFFTKYGEILSAVN